MEENEIPNSDLHTRNPDARGLDKAAFATKILPPLDLTPYMIKDPAGVKDRRSDVPKRILVTYFKSFR